MPEKKKRRIAKKNDIVIAPVDPSKTSEVQYRKSLQALVKSMAKFVKSEILPVIKKDESQYVRDDYTDDITKKLNKFKDKFFNINRFSRRVSKKFIDSVEKNNKSKFNSEIKKAVGADPFFNNKKLQSIIKAKIEENVNLITTQSQEYFRNISNAVFEGVTQGKRASAIEKDLQKITEKADNRVKFIARDQVNKANAALNEEKQRQLGIDEYEWRDSRDQRVRGKSNPSGIYKNSKFDHYARNGKRFKWSEPPPDGHPGQPYGCRCRARAVIKFETITVND